MSSEPANVGLVSCGLVDDTDVTVTRLSISAPIARSLLFLSLTLSVCLSVCLFVTEKLQSDSSVLFLDGIEPFYGLQFSMTPSTKHCFSIFDLGPPDAQNLLPKICTKSPINRLV